MITRSKFGEMPLPLFQSDEAPVVPVEMAKPPSYIKDHRARLRSRFLNGGADALPDYEMLELVLFRAIPRKDVKPLARALLDHFHNFNGVITAPAVRLSEIEGVGPAVILELKLIASAAQRLAQSELLDKQIISSWSALVDYCHTVMAHRDTEQFRVLYLNQRNELIADEAQAEGTVNHVPVYTREVAKRALELNASALILVHNHPSGDPTPSEADIAVTHQMHTALSSLDITLHDHLIIGKSQETSFRSEGLL